MNGGQAQRVHPGKPLWLRRKIPHGVAFGDVRLLLKNSRLHTVCQEALCPNLGECFSNRTATFLILGDRCTRDCRFCAVRHGTPGPLDLQEPARVAQATCEMGLEYVVITSVTRDDLADGGAGVFAETISQLHRTMPAARVEVLIPDFQGNAAALETVLKTRPHVLNHNLETVPRLYPLVRPQADYDRSLDLLRRACACSGTTMTKSGIMLGLGETRTEIQNTLRDLCSVGCRFLTLGQYLQPSKEHLPVQEFVHPDVFEQWKEEALEMGFAGVASGPFVRSSYHARNLYERAM